MLQRTHSSVVVIDDEPEWLERVRAILTPHGYTVHLFSSPEAGLLFVREHTTRVLAVLVDVLFDGQERGLSLLEELTKLPGAPPVLMLSSHEKASFIERALKSGAESYVPKSDLETLPERLAGFQDRALLHDPFAFLRHYGILTKSPAMAEVARKIQSYARTKLNVLICGEPGTGKSLVAHAFHHYSGVEGELVEVDVPALGNTDAFLVHLFGKLGENGLSMGFFHRAHRGTLFLDEIGVLRPEYQQSLLKSIEEKRFYPIGSCQPESVQTRILATTNQDIAAMVDSGAFRRDLYDRLAQVSVFIPPLRTRPEDIELLTHYFVRNPTALGLEPLDRPIEIPEPTLKELCQYPWPGNVRQLKNVLSQCLTIAAAENVSTITPRILHRVLPTLEPPSLELKQEQERLLRAQILEALRRFNGNVTRAAQHLGYSREHLHRLMRKFGISRQDIHA